MCRAYEGVQQHRLSGGHAGRHRHDGRAEPLGALVKAEPAREQPVAVGVVDDGAWPDAGHREAAGHDMGPRLEIGGGIADDGRLAPRPAGGVDADELLARHGEQPEGVVLAQLALRAERQPDQVVERADVTGRFDAARAQALAAAGHGGHEPVDGVPQSLELERLEPLARRGFDVVEDHSSRRAVGGIPVLFEVADERGAEVAEGLLARVRGHVGAEEVERLLARQAQVTEEDREFLRQVAPGVPPGQAFYRIAASLHEGSHEACDEALGG